MGSYTETLEGRFWEMLPEEEEDNDLEYLFDQLNSDDFLRPFSERLLHFMQDELSQSFTPAEAASELNRRMREREIPGSINTVKNWFSGNTAPKYGDQDRLNMYRIAFALDLTRAKTEDFFRRVLLDRGFNYRNTDEFIYSYCLQYRMSFSAAEAMRQKLKSVLPAEASVSDLTMSTKLLAQPFSAIPSDDEVVQFILEHPHNFSLNNTKAKAHLKNKISAITGDKNRKGLAQLENESGRTVSLTGGEKVITGEIIESKNKDPHSIDYMLSVIYGRSTGNAKEDLKRVKAVFSRREITNQFPNKESFSLADPSAYILRKELILLQFYWFFRNADGNSDADIYDDFIAEMNDILQDSGFASLYLGNPYDWLFLYCATCSKPLDMFREIMNYGEDDDEFECEASLS